MGDGTTADDKLKWLASRVAELEQDLNRERMETHRLRGIAQAADLHHIRLRNGLRQAIKWLDGAVPDAALAELQRLLPP